MEIVLLLIRLILFAIFAVAAVGKFLDLKGSEQAVKAFGTPEEYAKFFSVALPFAELVFAVCLLFTATSWTGAIGCLILLLSFIGGMIWQLAQGNAPECHCFGAIHSEPVSKKSLIRNIVFALLAFVLILSGKNNQGAGIFESADDSGGNFMTVILGLATIGLLAAAIYFLKRILEQQTQIMRRMEILELTALEGGKEVFREEVAVQTEGLPIGSPAPEISLPDTNSKQISIKNLTASGKPILLFFVSPTCTPCANLLPEIEAWQTDLKGKVNFVFVSSGAVRDNLEKLAGNTLKQILLQKDREAILAFGAQWTPTAILINADGKIASRAAVGDKAIRELAELIKSRINDEVLLIPNGNPLLTAKLGEDVPEFFESDVNDKMIASQDLRGKQTLVTFWSLTCGFCTKMLDDLRDWDKTKAADAPNLLVISEGEPEPHRSLDLRSPIVLDKDRKISKELGMNGTPSAVLINEDGKIISETAVGADNIWTLIGTRK